MKYLNGNYLITPIDAILDLFIFDYKEKQKEIIKEDAKIWLLVSAWATTYSNMRSKKQQPYPLTSINDIIEETTINSQNLKKENLKDLVDWGNEKADKISKLFNKKLAKKS